MTTQTTRPTNAQPTPILAASAGSNTSPQANGGSTPKKASPAGTQTPAPTKEVPTPMERASGREQATPRARADAAPKMPAPVGSHTPPTPANRRPTPSGSALGLADPFFGLAAEVLDDLEKVRIANENRLRALIGDEVDADGEETGWGLMPPGVEDLKHLLKLVTDELKTDKPEPLPDFHPTVWNLAVLIIGIKANEDAAVLNLQRLMRRHPLGPWAKDMRGVGDKQIARLLAAIGDPYWNTLYDRPRKVSELIAYCGYDPMNIPADQMSSDAQKDAVGGDQTGHPDQKMFDTHRRNVGVARKRARGQRANWSATAKMRARLVAEKCAVQIVKATCPVDPDIKAATHADGCACSPLRKVYDATRAKYADAIHQTQCAQCGPEGKPAQTGSPLSDGHKHARALRAVSKELLKELWREAKRLHEQTAPDEIGGR